MASTTGRPTQNGEIIYATQENVKVYREASITTAFVQVNTKNDNPIFASGQEIGEYMGQQVLKGSTLWYKVRWIHRWQGRIIWNLAKLRNRTKEEILTGWVIADQITTLSDDQLSIISEKEYQQKIDDILEDGETTTVTPKANILTTASLGLGSEDSSKNLIYLGIAASVGVLGWLFFKRRKKNKKPTIKNINVPK